METRISKIVASGTHKDTRWWILERGITAPVWKFDNWFCAYLEIPKGFDKDIDVPGGITFEGSLETIGKDINLIGWDYNHIFDLDKNDIYKNLTYRNGVEPIIKEVKKIIEEEL